MNILFICLANLNRSPRAAEVFQKLANQKGLDVEVQSAGTNTSFGRKADPELLLRGYGVKSVTQLTNEMLEKADIVVALDSEIRKEIETDYLVIPRKIITLDVEDRYSLGRKNLDSLFEILNRKLEPLAEELSLLQRKRPGKEAL